GVRVAEIQSGHLPRIPLRFVIAIGIEERLPILPFAGVVAGRGRPGAARSSGGTGMSSGSASGDTAVQPGSGPGPPNDGLLGLGDRDLDEIGSANGDENSIGITMKRDDASGLHGRVLGPERAAPDEVKAVHRRNVRGGSGSGG